MRCVKGTLKHPGPALVDFSAKAWSVACVLKMVLMFSLSRKCCEGARMTAVDIFKCSGTEGSAGTVVVVLHGSQHIYFYTNCT